LLAAPPPPRARGRGDPADRSGVSDGQRARPACRVRHGHGGRGVPRPGPRPDPGERHGDRCGEGPDARGVGQRRAVSPHATGARAAAAHLSRAALRARPRLGARATHRRGAEAAQGGPRLIAGVALVAKPGGPTSHDVVDQVRRVLGLRRVGHLGTLDPFAAGLLVIVVGRATRLAPYAAEWTKAYEGVIRLGRTTATDDATGPTAGASDAWQSLDLERGLDAREVERLPGVRGAGTGLEAGRALAGRPRRRPPAYSAVKVEGERAYRRARRGEAVALAARPVLVSALELVRFAPPDVAFRATVSGGTYLRGLARDAGEELGCGAHLATLVRTRVGPFRLEDGVMPERLTAGDLRDPATLVAEQIGRAH